MGGLDHLEALATWQVKEVGSNLAKVLASVRSTRASTATSWQVAAVAVSAVAAVVAAVTWVA